MPRPTSKTIALASALGILLLGALAFAATGGGASKPANSDIPTIVTDRATTTSAALEPAAPPKTEEPEPEDESVEVDDVKEPMRSAETAGVDSHDEHEVVKPDVRDDEHDEDEYLEPDAGAQERESSSSKRSDGHEESGGD